MNLLFKSSNQFQSNQSNLITQSFLILRNHLQLTLQIQTVNLGQLTALDQLLLNDNLPIQQIWLLLNWFHLLFNIFYHLPLLSLFKIISFRIFLRQILIPFILKGTVVFHLLKSVFYKVVGLGGWWNLVAG